jgi:hypothetical protein
MRDEAPAQARLEKGPAGIKFHNRGIYQMRST